MKYNLYYDDKKFIPLIGETYWYVDTYGFIFSGKFTKYNINTIYAFIFAKNTTYFFKTRGEAEKYREFLNDVYGLRQEFIKNEENCCFCYNHYLKKLSMECYAQYTYQSFYFAKKNAKTLLKKYGEEYIKNYLLDIWD